jgi:hypothetical protein
MSFNVPEMPLAVNIWSFGTGPPAPPRVVTMGNLSYGRRVLGMPDTFNLFDAGSVTAQLLLPPKTDVRGQYQAGGSDLLEVEAGSGRFYICLWVDDFGRGFANEHRFAILVVQDPAKTPWP